MYTLELSADARSDLQHLDAAIRTRVRNQLTRLCETCDQRPHKALQGRHKGKFSLKVAKHYRILYTFDKRTKIINVSRIRHRSKVY